MRKSIWIMAMATAPSLAHGQEPCRELAAPADSIRRVADAGISFIEGWEKTRAGKELAIIRLKRQGKEKAARDAADLLAVPVLDAMDWSYDTFVELRSVLEVMKAQSCTKRQRTEVERAKDRVDSYNTDAGSAVRKMRRLFERLGWR